MTNLHAPPAHRIFLSYARDDDETFVKRLHADLTATGFTVWFDRESLMSRGLTFHHEIKDAIRTEVDRVVYVGGPKAALSAYVREEWQFALECDHVVVTPILRLGDYETCVPGELALLHCEDFRDDALYPTALAKLIAYLRQPNPKLGALFAVPSLPPHFLGRPELMRRVRDALLVDLQKPQVITSADAKVGMQGMGGIGKSVLAAALARNREVRQSYPDGIIWISCGQKLTRDDLLARLRDVAKDLGGDTAFESIPQGQGVLRELLQAKAVLLVLDDVWQSSDAQTFDVIGPRCRMLVTTRDAGILHALHGELVPVSLFTELEALQLLADAVGCERSALPPEALEVVRECGCLPLAVALSGGMAKAGHSWQDIIEALREADLEWAENREGANEQHRTVWNAMKASYDALPDAEKPRFAELAVFATDRTVPEAAVHVLWEHTGTLSGRNCTKLLINLAERSLVRLDEKPDTDGKLRRRISLHDLLHDYAVRVAGEPKALHQSLVDAYRKLCPGGWHTGPHDGYFFENLAYHLADMEMWPDCEGLVTGFPWLMRKCELGLLDSISADYSSLVKLAPAEVARRLEIWSAFFREKAHILRRGNAEWPAHKILLHLAVEHADDSPLTIGAEECLNEDRCGWFWHRRVSAMPNHVELNPCLSTFEGHKGAIGGVQELGNERIMSWSDSEKTLRIWDSQIGACLATLEGHTGSVKGALVLADGRILSWSYDKTLRLWDGQSAACLSTLEGHAEWVKGALALPDGRLLSWSDDKTLRLWDTKSGACLAVLEGHTHWVEGALMLADGRLISWSADNNLRIWDGKTGVCLRILEAHTNLVLGACVLADGRLLSWSLDRTLRLWDLQSGFCISTLDGPTDDVTYTTDDGRRISWSAEFRPNPDASGALVLAPDRLLSWSFKSLRLWDSKTGMCIATLEGHTENIYGALALNDGRFLSWSNDTTLRLWDSSGVCVAILNGHSSMVWGALLLSDGRLLSWSADKTLKIWDSKSGSCLRTLTGHANSVSGAVSLTDTRLLSWSWDATLRIWDIHKPVSVEIQDAHTQSVIAAAVLAENRILSTSDDGTLRIWDSESGLCSAILKGHAGSIWGALVLANGRLLSWSADKTLRLWNNPSGAWLATLEGHTKEVVGALALPNGRLLSWSWDKTLRIWDSQSGKCMAILEGHTDHVQGAFLADGTLVSWARDNTPRLWDISASSCLATLEGHTKEVNGVSVLPDGRLVSWSMDGTLRLWDRKSGACLLTLKGHSGFIQHARALPDGRLLSWSWDKTLRIWDSRTGKRLATFEGHADPPNNALMLPDGRLLSWSWHEMRIWDSQNGVCLDTVPEDKVARQHPEWCYERAAIRNPSSSVDGFFLISSDRAAELRHNTLPIVVACWNADANVTFCLLLADGTAVVTLSSGQVCILKLHHGHRHITLAEAEAILVERGDTSVN